MSMAFQIVIISTLGKRNFFTFDDYGLFFPENIIYQNIPNILAFNQALTYTLAMYYSARARPKKVKLYVVINYSTRQESLHRIVFKS